MMRVTIINGPLGESSIIKDGTIFLGTEIDASIFYLPIHVVFAHELSHYKLGHHLIGDKEIKVVLKLKSLWEKNRFSFGSINYNNKIKFVKNYLRIEKEAWEYTLRYFIEPRYINDINKLMEDQSKMLKDKTEFLIGK